MRRAGSGARSGAGSRGGPRTPTRRRGERPDLVERDFTAVGPNRLWVADLTYLRCWEGVLLPGVHHRRVLSRMIVGWQFAGHMRTDLVLDALRMAIGLRGPGADVALVHHSDQGSQYASFDYTQALDDHDVLQSIGLGRRRATTTRSPNRLVDSFKTELIADRVWRIALAARARRRRVHRLVQQRAAALRARLRPARRVRAPPPTTTARAANRPGGTRQQRD